MTKRELLALPKQREFEITDGIYSYSMHKIVTDGMVVQSWRVKGRILETFMILETVDVHTFDYEPYVLKGLKVVMSVGGIFSNSDLELEMIKRFTIVDERIGLNEWLSKHQIFYDT